MRVTDDWLREYTKRTGCGVVSSTGKVAGADRVAVQTPKQKRSGPNALVKAQKDPEVTEPCIVRVHAFRCGSRWDADNISIKRVLDSMVEARIFIDDCQEQIKKQAVIPHRIAHRAEERTVIEVWSVKQEARTQ